MNNTASSTPRPGEHGWVLLTAMSLLSIMTIVALATVALVDTQTKRSREQRERESSLNLAEAALYQQGFKLAQGWPTAEKPAQDCSSGTVTAACPAPTAVLANATNVDTQAKTTWSTVVRDNGGDLCGAFRADRQDAAQGARDSACNPVAGPTCPGPCRWDANGDKSMWVRSQALVRGRTRTIVAQLKLERIAESVPRTAVTAGGVNTGNQGAQVKIFAVGSQVVVRCDPNATSGSGSTKRNTCVSDNAAIQPAAVQGAVANIINADQIARFKSRAMADGTYYAGCPKDTGNGWDLSGEVVFVDRCSAAHAKLAFPTTASTGCALPPKPSGAGNGLTYDCINTNAKPGLLIWHCGGFGTAGSGTFIGVMYFVNGSDGGCPATGEFAPRGTNPTDCSGSGNSASNVLALAGGIGVLGAIAIDGSGCLYAAANGIQVQFDPNVFGAVASYGTVGLVQNSWRELIPS